MARVLITGGAGFIGSRLAVTLWERGDEVIILDSLSAGRLPGHKALLELDGITLLQASVTAPFPDLPPVDMVAHLASVIGAEVIMARPVNTLRVGLLGAMNALEFARRNEARCVLASSSEIYGDPLVHPQPEDYNGNVDPTAPLGAYDEAKRASEALAFAYRREHSVDTGVVRPFNVYGPGMRPDDRRVVAAFIRSAMADADLTLHGDGSQTRSLCYVDDFVAGFVSMLDSDESGPVNLGNPEEVTMRQLADLIVWCVGRGRVVTTPGRVQDAGRRRPDITYAGKVLGWEPQVPLVDGIVRTVEWYRSPAASGR